MTSPHELSANADCLRAHFRERFESTARFREDRALAESLLDDALPVLRALAQAGVAPLGVSALHDAYAQLSSLCRRAALLDGTPSVAVIIPEAIVHALKQVGIELESAHKTELAIVAAEAYTAARDEQTTSELRRCAAESQVAFALAPHCWAILLAGTHAEPDLTPVLERFARELLRDDVRSCLLDVTRLLAIDRDLTRALGRFCSQATTLGVRVALVASASSLGSLSADFDSWTLTGPLLTFHAEYDRAQRATLAAAGLEVRFLRRWARLFLPAGSGLVR